MTMGKKTPEEVVLLRQELLILGLVVVSLFLNLRWYWKLGVLLSVMIVILIRRNKKYG